MSHKICREGQDYPGGVFIVPGAICIPDRDVPVTTGFDYNAHFGKANDIRRTDDGWLEAELDFDLPDGLECSVALRAVAYHDFKGTRFFTNGDLVQIALVPANSAGFPKNEE